MRSLDSNPAANWRDASYSDMPLPLEQTQVNTADISPGADQKLGRYNQYRDSAPTGLHSGMSSGGQGAEAVNL